MARAVLSASLLRWSGRRWLALVGLVLALVGVVVEFHKHNERIVIVEALLMLEDCTVEVVGRTSR